MLDERNIELKKLNDHLSNFEQIAIVFLSVWMSGRVPVKIKDEPMTKKAAI